MRPNPEAASRANASKWAGSQYIATDHVPEEGGAGGSENPGVGGSIPSQPTIHFKQLSIRELLTI
jgi:hypothetical protein